MLRPVAIASTTRRAALAVLFACCSLAASPAGARSLRFEQLTVEQGLAQESVTSAVQDRQGFMWFGSQAGLSRYDGYKVIVYKNKRNDPHSLDDNFVQSLLVDEQGRLWVGTEGGLNLYDAATDSFTRFSPPASSRPDPGGRAVNAIVADGKGVLWLGTASGLQRYDTVSGTFAILRHDPKQASSVADNRITSLARDAQGALWVGTVLGLDRLAPGSKAFEHFRTDAGGLAAGSPSYAARNTVRALASGPNNTLWIGTADGLEQWSFNRGSISKLRFGAQEGVKPGAIYALYSDQRGRMWVGTSDDGLKMWEPGAKELVHYRHAPSERHGLASNQVTSLYQDRSGTLWVGTWTAGANRVDLASGGFKRVVQTQGDPASLSSNSVRAMVGDGHGIVWLATSGGGLNRYDRSTGKATAFRKDPAKPGSLPDDNLNALAFDARGILWIGANTGVIRFDPATGKADRVPVNAQDRMGNAITAIMIERSGQVWAGSLAGLHRIDPLTLQVTHYQNEPGRLDSLVNNSINGLMQDRQGVLWVGTDGGLDRLDPATGRFTHFRHDPDQPGTISHDRVHTFYQDRKGTFWIGTAGGLSRMETGREGAVSFRSYTAAEGLGADPIGGILDDDKGFLWISTTAGISRFDPALAKFRNYTGRDGMIEDSYFIGSAWQEQDGTMFFGGINGMSEFRADEIRNNPNPPVVMITDFLIFNQSVRGGKLPEGFSMGGPLHEARVIKLSHRHAIFSLEFAAMHFANPERNQYAYQLEGVDPDWVMTDASKRFATYTNLEPGQYHFRVRAANKDGVWNDVGTSLEIDIAPPFWKTTWFRILAILLVLLAFYVIDRVRLLAMVRQRRLLEEKVRERTAELAAANQSLRDNDDKLRLSATKAEDATRVKSEFLANMSHEIRTPMSAIIGMAYLALHTDLNPKQQDYVGKIHRAALSLLGIINDVLDFSKIEAGKVDVEKVVFSLDEVMANVASVTNQKADEKKLAYLISIADTVPRQLVGDPLRLGQVLINLVNNAIKFTDDGEIEISCVVIGRSEGKVKLWFSVRDTGIGMSAEQLARLFQPFTQADGSTSRKYGGTGLGLSISQRLMEIMGGNIDVYSSAGSGSTFSFSLWLTLAPLDAKAMPQLPFNGAELGRARAQPQFDGKLVLVAEDNDINQQIVIELLGAVGVRVDIANTGNEVISKLKEAGPGGYGLVLMDLEMPEMDGHAATVAIRQDPAYNIMPIIAMTAHAMTEVRDRCLKEGMQDYLTKPINPEHLFHTLARWLDVAGPAAAPAAAPAAGPAPFKTAMPKLAGIDSARGLAVVMGNRDLYLDLLRRFGQSQRSTAAQLQQEWDRGDLAAAQRRAHSLRSVAANIGALDVEQSAQSLEMKLGAAGIAAGDPAIALMIAELSRSLNLVLEALHALEPAPAASAAPGASGQGQSADAQAALEQLRALLKECSGESPDYFDSIRASLAGTVDAGTLDQVAAHIGQFEFEQASRLLA
jgi:signal transduction histidine kinase/ligand-binding sensor domain-containing protein/CheY-like chemotaxis protein/HPt (histidine-containing phosphotransfer) domain-containing protein